MEGRRGEWEGWRGEGNGGMDGVEELREEEREIVGGGGGARGGREKINSVNVHECVCMCSDYSSSLPFSLHQPIPR